MTAITATHVTERSDVSRLRALWWLALLLVLGPLWLVQRDVWDGVIGSYGLQRGVYKGIHDWLVPSNWGLMYLIVRAMGWLSELLAVPHWVWAKLLLCASVIGISLESRRLCAGMLGWGERDSRAAGLLALTFPCWYLLYGSTFVYLVFVWWMFLGHRWLHGASRWRQAAGFVLLLASFQVNSNLVMVFALEAARWLCRDRGQTWSWRRSALIALCAIGVYLALRLVFPPQGNYAGYNKLVMPLSVEGVVAWVRAALMFATWLPLIAAPAVLGWMLARTEPREARDPRRELLAIALLFGGALFAYMAVGKGAPLFVVTLPLQWLGAGAHLGREAGQWIYTTVDGWSTRHTFLLSVPAAIASVGLLRIAVSRAEGTAAPRSWWAGLAFALVADLLWMLHGHGAKLARMAQEEAIIQALRATPAPPAGRLDLQLAPRPGWSVWTYEANYWMWLAHGRAAWAVAAYPRPQPGQPVAAEPAVVDRESAVAATQLRDFNVMSDYPPGGCATVWQVRLSEGLGASDYLLARVGARPVPPAALSESARRCDSASPQG